MGHKQVAYYDPELTVYIEVGKGALVWPVQHPNRLEVTCTKHALTSPVVIYNEATGVFETLNTRYIPKNLVN